MAAGLLYVYTDPGPDGPVSEAEYHDWYDHEHGPARMTVPGFTGARRYQAIDGQQPPWLALYETASLEALDGPEYKAVVAGGSDREKFIMSHLATLDRRVYELLSEDLPAGSADGPAGPAPAILSVANTVPPEMEDDMAAWYEQEHIPMLLEVPGWQRLGRAQLVGARLAVAARSGRARGARGTRLPGGGQHAVAGPDRGLGAAAGTARGRAPHQPLAAVLFLS